MSAIAGFLDLDGREVVASEVERMAEVLAHRGPDGRATWVDREVGLVHCMLHTTPESLTECLPRKFGALTITADARIDNREELISKLGGDVRGADPVSDSELILRAYERWRLDCPSHLLGDFAFAIWDSARRELFCARDHLGVRPLYFFHQAGRRFVFATEIKGIFAYPDIPREINEAKIADYMLASFEDKTRTFYVGISRLPSGSSLTVNRAGVQVREYWRLEPTNEVRLKSNDEYAEAFRAHFVEAVRCRLRSAFPVGSMLSGGLDSSSISCVAHDLMSSRINRDLHSFSIVFDQVKKSDEREFINKVLEGRHFTPHLIDGDCVSPLDDLDRVLWHQDEPFYAPNLSLTRSAWQSAKQNGVRVLLDGLLGDNIVSHGIEYMRELANRWRWITLARRLRELIDRSGRDVPLWQPLQRYIWSDGVKPYVPQTALSLVRKMRGDSADSFAAWCGLFSTEYCGRTHLRERFAQAHASSHKMKSSRQSHIESINSGMVQTALESYDKGCGEFEVETRFPFVDRRLAEFCVAIPGDQKISEGYTRMIVRRGLAGYLPRAIHDRADKGDLGWSFRNGFENRADQFDALLESTGPFLSQYFDMARLSRVRERYGRGKLNDEESLQLFLLIVLSAWRSKRAERGGLHRSQSSVA
jgi:asparagine synthase (glutamine-hydrolysing)